LESTGREADDLRSSKRRLSSSLVFLNLKFIGSIFDKVLNLCQMEAHGLFAFEPSEFDSIFVPSANYYREYSHGVSINFFIVMVMATSYR